MPGALSVQSAKKLPFAPSFSWASATLNGFLGDWLIKSITFDIRGSDFAKTLGPTYHAMSILSRQRIYCAVQKSCNS